MSSYNEDDDDENKIASLILITLGVNLVNLQC